MRKFLVLLVIGIIGLLGIEAYSSPITSACRTIMVIKIDQSCIDWPKSEEDDGDRTPAERHSAKIDMDSGVEIAGCTEDISIFEIWTEDGSSCISSTDEEENFLKDFYTLKGFYQVRFLTDNYIYIGEVTLK